MKRWKISITSLLAISSLPITSLVGCSKPVHIIHVQDIKLNKESALCEMGHTYIGLFYTITPTDATNQNVHWHSSAESVATVDEQGNIKGISPGNAIISVETEDGGFVDSCNLTVFKIDVDSVTINGEKTKLYVEETQQLEWKVLPTTASDKSVKWNSSNPNAATVSKDGLVTAVAPGETTISVTSVDNPSISDSYTLTVEQYIPVEDVNIKEPETELLEEATQQLEWEVLPATASEQAVTWNSSNPNVATVSDGLVTAVAPGETTISVTSVDNPSKGDSYKLTVIEYVPVENVRIQEGNKGEIIFDDNTRQLSCKVLPENATELGVVWDSSDKTVATISQDGKITTHKVGTTTITVKSIENEDISDSYSLTVVDAPTKVENFETDSWLTVTYFANQGFDKLAEMYGHTADPEWFIGKERDLKMNGQTYKVQVVGIKQDYLDANRTKPVALTFRFKNLVSDKDGHYMRIEWQKRENNRHLDYWNSTLNNALNGNENNVQWESYTGKDPVPLDQQFSVLSMIRESEPFLADNIQNVYRGMNTGGEKEGWTLESKTTKLFCPTLSNLFSNEGIRITDSSHMPTDRSLCCREGQPHDFETEDAQYAYFANPNNIGDSPVEDQDGDDIMFSCLQLKDLVNGFYFMQLGSVILNDDDEVWIIAESGYFIHGYNLSYYTVAPFFCI